MNEPMVLTLASPHLQCDDASGKFLVSLEQLTSLCSHLCSI
jgi:hypothetical protein